MLSIFVVYIVYSHLKQKEVLYKNLGGRKNASIDFMRVWIIWLWYTHLFDISVAMFYLCLLLNEVKLVYVHLSEALTKMSQNLI